jgi:hypothetical protein
MKKFITFLFLSFFVSQINAAMMPVDLNVASSIVVASSHDHCQAATSAGPADDGKSGANASSSHYCCAVMGILNTSPIFLSSKQIEAYTRSDVESPASNIPESIYKPPRNYL